MREWVDALLAVVLAPTCGACARPLLHPTRGCVCADCWNGIIRTAPPLCNRCGGQVPQHSPAMFVCSSCIRSGSEVSAARAAGMHVGSLRAIVHALKYDGRRSLAAPLASLMRSAGQDLLRASEAAVPVPLHESRRRARGFNQADDLARHIGLPVVRALRRIRKTATQTALPAPERHANVAGAFGTTRQVLALEGASVLLIDDVRTTGATLDACASTLRAAGVREVFALTAARVETPGS
jgi:ComF family protein